MPTKPSVPLNGNHHVTGITADVQANLDFWCRVLGLRFVKKTLNFETTFRYHPYYGDREGAPGSVVTFLEFNDVERGLPGRGNIGAAVLRVGSREALEYWMDRLTAEQVYSERMRLDPTQPDRLVFRDFEGHTVELMESDDADAPMAAPADDIPEPYRIRGIEGVRSLAALDDVAPFAEHLGYRRDGRRLVLDGATRSSRWYFAPPPDRPYAEFAVGVWHHLALDAGDALQAWRDYGAAGPVPFTEVYDHYFFDSCYSPSPGGLVELASYGPGFLIDQPVEELGERLGLSPRVEPLREKLERDLTPMTNPRRSDGTLVGADGRPAAPSTASPARTSSKKRSTTGDEGALADA